MYIIKSSDGFPFNKKYTCILLKKKHFMLCKHKYDSDDNIINILKHSEHFIWYDSNGTVPKQYNAKG